MPKIVTRMLNTSGIAARGNDEGVPEHAFVGTRRDDYFLSAASAAGASIEISLTSKISVAFGPIVGGAFSP